MLEIHEVAPDYDASWVPSWARGLPILKYGDKDPPYSYQDLAKWPETEEKVEIIDGLLLTMAFPTSFHEGINSELIGQLRDFIKSHKINGRVYGSHLGVHLSDSLTVAPDISVVLDLSKITMEGCQGAPDFIVEILSPSNQKEDRKAKFDGYRAAGVREYWIVDPETRLIETYLLKDGAYIARPYDGGKVPVATLPDLFIDFDEVFAYADVGQLAK
jgi:Uma2 family endonuclease